MLRSNGNGNEIDSLLHEGYIYEHLGRWWTSFARSPLAEMQPDIDKLFDITAATCQVSETFRPTNTTERW
eukprot:scaffold430883_cov14-Prasinocladus_malaysianus.AAC.2